MRQGSHCLHFNGVPLIKGVVEDSWRVDDLPALVLVVGVPDEEVLRCECIWLHFDISIRNIVHETRLAHVGEASYDESPRVSVDLRQSTHVLSHLLQVAEGRFKFLEECAGSTEGSALELLCSVQGISVLQQAHVVVRHTVCDCLRLVHVAKSQLVVVPVVKDIHQVAIEGVDVVQFWESIDNARQLLVDGFLHELDFAHVELPDALDFEASRDLRRGLSLCLGQGDIDQVAGLGDLDDVLEVVCHGNTGNLFYY